MRFLGLVQVTGLISIHALRVEGDSIRLPLNGRNYISIHALRVEGDALPLSSTRAK